MKIDQDVLAERIKQYLDKHPESVNNTSVINSFTSAIADTHHKISLIGEPIPWVESAINMPYLDAIKAFAFGSSLSAIDTMTLSLEFTFRLALSDWNNTGFHSINTEELTKPSWKPLFEKQDNQEALNILLPDTDDRTWWEEAVTLRNKINHYDIKYLIDNYKRLGYSDSIVVDFHGGDYTQSHTWGAIYHKLIFALAKDFVPKASSMLRKLINNTRWPQGTKSIWGSHKELYDEFFSLDWRPLHLQYMLDLYIEKSPGIVKRSYENNS